MIHHSLPPDKIMKNCSLVISISGTASLEAAFYEKPSILFADMSFDVLPSIYKIKLADELPTAIRTSLEKRVDIDALNKYVNFIDKNSFEFNELHIIMEILERFYVGGFMADVDIKPSTMEIFLKDFDDIFSKLADEFITKIKSYDDIVA